VKPNVWGPLARLGRFWLGPERPALGRALRRGTHRSGGLLVTSEPGRGKRGGSALPLEGTGGRSPTARRLKRLLLISTRKMLRRKTHGAVSSPTVEGFFSPGGAQVVAEGASGSDKPGEPAPCPTGTSTTRIKNDAGDDVED